MNYCLIHRFHPLDNPLTLRFFKWWSWEHLLSIFEAVLWEESSKMHEERWEEYMFCVSMSLSHIVVGIGYISLRDPLAISRSYCDWVVQLPLKTVLWLCWQSAHIQGQSTCRESLALKTSSTCLTWLHMIDSR